MSPASGIQQIEVWEGEGGAPRPPAPREKIAACPGEVQPEGTEAIFDILEDPCAFPYAWPAKTIW
jgi:hypothetical protein